MRCSRTSSRTGSTTTRSKMRALAGFEWIYLGIWEHGRLRAAVPGFVTEYRLDTTLSGPLEARHAARSRASRRACSAFRSFRSARRSARSAISASPPTASSTNASVLPQALVAQLIDFAARRRIGMIAVKDASGADDALWAAACGEAGLRRMPGQATALLDCRSARSRTISASLGPSTRKRHAPQTPRARRRAHRMARRDRRSCSTASCRSIAQTLAQAEYTLEELTPAYFRGVMRDLRRRALCATYWLDEQLIGFNLVLRNRPVPARQVLRHGLRGRPRAQPLLSELDGKRALLHRARPRALPERPGPRTREARGSAAGSRRTGSGIAIATASSIACSPRSSARSASTRPRTGRAAAGGERMKHAGSRARPSLRAGSILLALGALCQIALKYAGLDTGPFDFSPHAFARRRRSAMAVDRGRSAMSASSWPGW